MTNDAFKKLLDAAIRPVNDRLDKLDQAIEPINDRLDKLDAAFKPVNERLDKLDAGLNDLRKELKASKFTSLFTLFLSKTSRIDLISDAKTNSSFLL